MRRHMPDHDNLLVIVPKEVDSKHVSRVGASAVLEMSVTSLLFTAIRNPILRERLNVVWLTKAARLLKSKLSASSFKRISRNIGIPSSHGNVEILEKKKGILKYSNVSKCAVLLGFTNRTWQDDYRSREMFVYPIADIFIVF